VIVFEDTGEILPDGTMIERTAARPGTPSPRDLTDPQLRYPE